MWDSDPVGDGRGARPPRRADRRRRWRRTAGASSSRWARATRRSRCSTRRRQALDGRDRGHPGAGRGALAGRAPPRSPLRAPHRRGGAPRHRLLRADAQPRGAAARAGRRRPDLPLVGRPPTSSRRTCPTGCELVDLGPHRLKGVGAPGADPRAQGTRASTRRCPSRDCPYRGLLAFEADDRAFFFGREEVVEELLARLAPGRLLALVGASGSGKSSVLRAGVVAAVEAGEVDGIDRVRLVDPRRRAARSTSRARRASWSSSTSSRSCSRCATTRSAGGAFIDALLALPGPVGDRRARRPLRAAEHPRGARARGRRQPDPARRDDRRRAASAPSPSRRGWPGCGSSRGWSSSSCATWPASPAPCRCSRTRCARPGSGATGAR